MKRHEEISPITVGNLSLLKRRLIHILCPGINHISPAVLQYLSHRQRQTQSVILLSAPLIYSSRIFSTMGWRLPAPVFILSDPLFFNLGTDNPNHTLLPGIIFQKFPFHLKPFFFFFPHILLFPPAFSTLYARSCFLMPSLISTSLPWSFGEKFFSSLSTSLINASIIS